MQCVDKGRRFFLTYSPAILVGHFPRLPFDFIQPANRVQRLFGQLAFVRRMQIEELAAGMGMPISVMPC